MLFLIVLLVPAAVSANQAVCLDPAVERETCLREMRNARGEKFPDPNLEEFRKNRLDRCDIFPKEERETCINRILNGHVRGKISEGGRIIEYTETVK